MTTILWFRRDLRLEDNRALCTAVERSGPVIPVYIWAPEEEGDWPPGAAGRWWLHHSLTALHQRLTACGSRLIVRRGNSLRILSDLIGETGADCVLWNRLYEPAAVQRDQSVAVRLRKRGIRVETFNAGLLFEPSEVKTQQGRPYRAFTPFWKACGSRGAPDVPWATPGRLASPSRWPESRTIDSLQLLPKIDWAAGLRDAWTPGADGAGRRLERFLSDAVVDYKDDRDRAAVQGTSRLSPHLHFGEIGPRQVWHAVKGACSDDRRTREGKSAELFLSELGWREFAHHVLFHFPHTPDEPLQPRFARIPWDDNPDHLQKWQRGRTGYPIVDAGMRELWATGWMHNRARMIVGSFLTKDLLLAWQQGARWFWETLVDADLANNTLGWQWIAGCGADAAPFFRIFNPLLQAEKFDPAGDYVRRWVPELAGLPDRWIHKPWEAPGRVLKESDVEPGSTYPLPIVDHAEARHKALQAFKAVKRGG